MIFIDTDPKARIFGRVQLCRLHPRRILGSVTSDLKVDAARIILCAALVASIVKGDPFVSYNIISRRDRFRDLRGPRVVLIVQLVRCPSVLSLKPLPGWVDFLQYPEFVDLEEFQRCLIDGFALAVAVGEVGHHRPMVGSVKGIPLKGDVRAGGNLDAHESVGRAFAADNIGVLVSVRQDAARIPCFRNRPTGTDVGRVQFNLVRFKQWMPVPSVRIQLPPFASNFTYVTPSIMHFKTRPWAATVEENAKDPQRAIDLMVGILANGLEIDLLCCLNKCRKCKPQNKDEE